MNCFHWNESVVVEQKKKQQAVKLSGQDEKLVETISGMTEVEHYNKHLCGCGYAPTCKNLALDTILVLDTMALEHYAIPTFSQGIVNQIATKIDWNTVIGPAVGML